jgi:hypothetical protein
MISNSARGTGVHDPEHRTTSDVLAESGAVRVLTYNVPSPGADRIAGSAACVQGRRLDRRRTARPGQDWTPAGR